MPKLDGSYAPARLVLFLLQIMWMSNSRFFASLTLALLSFSQTACTNLPVASQAKPNPAHNDSMRTECPGAVPAYASLTAVASLAQLQQSAELALGQQGLRVLWQLQSPHATAQAFTDQLSDRQRLGRLLDAILPALARYPRVFFQHMQVRDVVIVKDLQVDGQFRLAMPAPETDSLVYADNGHPQLCLAGMEMRTHHEFYHVIEHRLFKDFYFRDPDWLALNPAIMVYGQGGATAYGKQFENLGHPAMGLVSRYAAYGPEEDKAEVFGWMMTPEYAQRLKQWAQQDTALAAKLKWMQDLLQKYSQ